MKIKMISAISAEQQSFIEDANMAPNKTQYTLNQVMCKSMLGTHLLQNNLIF